MGMRRIPESQGPDVYIVHFLGVQLVPMSSPVLLVVCCQTWPPLCPSRLTGRLVVHQADAQTETQSMLFNPHALKQDGVSFESPLGKTGLRVGVLPCVPPPWSTWEAHSGVTKLLSVRRWVSKADLDVQICFLIHSVTLSCPLTGPCFSVHIYI